MVFPDAAGRIETVGDFITGEDDILYSRLLQSKDNLLQLGYLGRFSIQWYESEHGKYLSWLTEDDGYILARLLHLLTTTTDKEGNLYQYDLETDIAIPIDGTLYNHAGMPINGFKEDFAEFVEIQHTSKKRK